MIDIFDTLNLCKCHNVPPPSTTIILKRRNKTREGKESRYG
jgi:hypothetical protein